MNLPADKEIIHGEVADYCLDDGILISDLKPVQRTVENIAANVALVKQITGNKRIPLLIFLKRSPVPDKETRKFSAAQVPQIYLAMAMVSKPGLSMLVMKMVFQLKKPPIPTRSFTSEAEARNWLRQFV